MRNIIVTIFVTLCLATSALAGPNVKQVVPFSMYSSANSTAVYSTVINATPFRKKTVVVNGYNMSSTTSAALSGTALVQCGPTQAGPWTTCVSNNYAQTAISMTSNGSMTWEDVSGYIRVSWAKTAGLVKVWLNLSE